MVRSAAIILAVTAGLAGCAQQTRSEPAALASSGRECFHAGNINGFTPRSGEVVDVRVGTNRWFRLQLIGYCPNVDWTQALALRTRGGSSWICQGFDAELIVPNPPTSPQRCQVSSVRRLSDAEVKALRLR